MKLDTKYLGVVEIDEKKKIYFPNGLPGFPAETEFIILDLPNNAVFQLLQSTKTSNLAFVITNPYLFFQAYELKLDEDLLDQLKITAKEDVTVYAIVTLSKPFSQSTMNLRAPLIINTEQLIGKQYILNDHTYSSKVPIAPDEKGARSC